MVLKVLLKFPPALVLVHGWLFPEYFFSDFSSSTLKRHLLKRHLTLSDLWAALLREVAHEGDFWEP